MNTLRNMQQLSDLQLPKWNADELKHHHQVMSDLSPWLNVQGVSIHHQIINEIEKRGGVNNIKSNFTD